MRCASKYKKFFLLIENVFSGNYDEFIYFTFGLGNFARQNKAVVIPRYEKCFYFTLNQSHPRVSEFFLFHA